MGQGHAGSTLGGVVVRVMRSQMRLAIGPVLREGPVRPKDELYPSAHTGKKRGNIDEWMRGGREF